MGCGASKDPSGVQPASPDKGEEKVGKETLDKKSQKEKKNARNRRLSTPTTKGPLVSRGHVRAFSGCFMCLIASFCIKHRIPLERRHFGYQCLSSTCVLPLRTA